VAVFNKDSPGYILIFSCIVCFICSLALSALQMSLKEAQDRNEKIDLFFNILKVFSLKIYIDEETGKNTSTDTGVKISPEEILALKEAHIEEIVYEPDGTIIKKDNKDNKPVSYLKMTTEQKDKKQFLSLFLFREKKDGPILKYAIPVSGGGLWGQVYGFLALEKDLNTIAAVTFYKHKETPGLGAECSKPWFQNNFKGKKILKVKGEVEDGVIEMAHFRVVKGKVKVLYKKSDPRVTHSVDGMSGATITGNGITNFVNSDVRKYEKIYFADKRSGKANK